MELQARGRIYRIGQTEETTIVSLTAKETFDERTNVIKDSKIDNIQKVMSSSSKKNLTALRKLFAKAVKNDDIVGPDSEEN
jgi:SNF2 family DNA or RNA helicase